MTRNPTARRVHRQDTGTDDAFVANVLESSVWAREHARTLIIAAVVVAVVAIAALLYTAQRRAAFEQATQEITPLRALVQSGQAEQAIPQLEAYLARHGGTKPAREARLMLGSQYLAAGQSAKALEVVRPIGDDYEDPMAVNGAFLQAAAHEASQEPQRAEEIFLEIAEKASFDFQKADALDNAARIRLARNDAAGAAELYQRLVDMADEQDGTRQVWEMRLAEARTMASAGGTATPAPATTTN